jgi:hypothetical protein
MRTPAPRVEPAALRLVYRTKRIVAPGCAAPIPRWLPAALGVIAVAVSVGGCAAMTPERCGAHTAAKDPPPLSVRCSVRF